MSKGRGGNIPDKGADAGGAASYAATERMGHKANRPIELEMALARMRADNNVASGTGSVESHSRSQSGLTSSPLAMESNVIAAAKRRASSISARMTASG